MTPEERLNAAFDSGSDKMAEAALALPRIIKSTSASGKRKVIMLKEIADQIASVVGPHTICRKGCSYCCHQHVMISELEARVIEDATGRPRAPVAPLDNPLDIMQVTREKQRRYIGVPCTFLGADGACTIYEHRPIRCRTHFSLHDDPKMCDTARGLGVKDVPFYENEYLTQASVMVTYRTTHADIREFFPK